METNPCQHSADGARFWFVSSVDGRRKSPVYEYEVLEKLGGRKRTEVCYPFLVSSKPLSKRMVVCNKPHELGHESATAAAHVAPSGDFLEKVRRHFEAPAAKRPDAAGEMNDPGSVRRPSAMKQRSKYSDPRSPRPGGAGRSSYRPEDRREASRGGASPGEDRARASSRSTSPSSERVSPRPPKGREASPRNDSSRRPRRREEKRSDSSRERAGGGAEQRRSSEGSPARSSEGGGGSEKEEKAGSSRSPSPRRKPRKRSSGASRVAWGAVSVMPGAQGAGPAASRPASPGKNQLIDLSAPCEAVVRTILFVVSWAESGELLFLMPAVKSAVLGSAAALLAPREAAVREAGRLAASLPASLGLQSLVCLPIFESIPAADDLTAVVDRVVALPVSGGAKMQLSAGSADSATFEWTRLGAIDCLLVYALAATVAVRMLTFSARAPFATVKRLLGLDARVRTGARPLRDVLAVGRDERQCDRQAGRVRTWKQALIDMRAADEVLRRALLAIPDSDPMAVDLRSFADVVRPVDIEEIPPYFFGDGALPVFDDESLRLLPFSTRVLPPVTEWLPRVEQKRIPPNSFKPESIHDLLEPRWLKRMVDWYEQLGDWLVDLSEVADDPDSDAAEAVRRARPRPLIIPRSAFVEEAKDVVWDLRGERPVPLDFGAPLTTHLNLNLIKKWQDEWPSYPDKEIFSHLLLGVRLKVDLPFQVVLQPHLASLSRGFVRVHKELVRLIEKGYFSVTPHPPFLPWFTLPSGSAERKLEPGRPRRIEDGSAPRQGERGAAFAVDKDGQRVLSINTCAVMPPDDKERGTHFIFYDAWARRLSGRSTPERRREVTHRRPREKAVLLLFSGRGDAYTSLARTIGRLGEMVEEMDILLDPLGADLSKPEVMERVTAGIQQGSYSFVFAAPPCDSASVAVSDTRPRLRSTAQPWGVSNVPKRWRAYLERRNVLFRNTAQCLLAAHQAGVPWAVENPSPRNDPRVAGYWSRYADWGTLWDCLRTLGISPSPSALADVPVTIEGVEESLVAACAFGAKYQKLTMFWSSAQCEPLRKRLDNKLCCHSAHAIQLKGKDVDGESRTSKAAQYTPGLARQLASGILETVAAGRGSAECPVAARAQLRKTASARAKRARSPTLKINDRCADNPAAREGLNAFPGRDPRCDASDIGGTRADEYEEPRPCTARDLRPSRVSYSDHPAAPALRGAGVVDVNITLESSTPTLANPFLLGGSGRDESLRELAVSTYASWLQQRTSQARHKSNGLRVARKLEHITGEDVLREVHRVVSSHAAFARFNLVCRRSCSGRKCHGKVLKALFEEVIEATSPTPFPKELKPTVPEILMDLAILEYLSHHTGIPLYQLMSDIKDFFNQHGLAPAEQAKVGLVTLDPRAIIEYVKALREACPSLASVAAHVLGYGVVPASNICQRTAHLLTFIWMARMEIEAKPIVEAMLVQHPFLRRWCADRRAHFGASPAQSRTFESVRFNQVRFWTFSMYTDDGHQAMLGVQLAVLGLRIWRDMTNSLKLQMALVQKHGLGQQVVVQGVAVNAGLGVAFVPPDKLRRALSAIELALKGEITVAEYRSLLGLLQSLLFIAGMSKASTYGLYTPLGVRWDTDPDELVVVTPWVADQLRAWRNRLSARAGSPFLNALPQSIASDLDAHQEAPAVFFLRSDAAKEGLGAAGLGGVMGGMYWRYPEEGPLPAKYLSIPIAVLEFVAYLGSVASFAPFIPERALVVSEVDALATADALTRQAAKSPMMQKVHLALMELPEFKRIARHHMVSHIFGEANVMADAASRGLYDVLQQLAGQLRLRLQIVRTHACVQDMLEALLLGVDELASTSIGMHNPCMTGSPFAQAAPGCLAWNRCACLGGSCVREADADGLCVACRTSASNGICGCDCAGCRPVEGRALRDNIVSLPGDSDSRRCGCPSATCGNAADVETHPFCASCFAGTLGCVCWCGCGGCKPTTRPGGSARLRLREMDPDLLSIHPDKVKRARLAQLQAAQPLLLGTRAEGGTLTDVCAPCDLSRVQVSDRQRNALKRRPAKCECRTGTCGRPPAYFDDRTGRYFCGLCCLALEGNRSRCACGCGPCRPNHPVATDTVRACACSGSRCRAKATCFIPLVNRAYCQDCVEDDCGVLCVCACGFCNPGLRASLPIRPPPPPPPTLALPLWRPTGPARPPLPPPIDARPPTSRMFQPWIQVRPPHPANTRFWRNLLEEIGEEQARPPRRTTPVAPSLLDYCPEDKLHFRACTICGRGVCPREHCRFGRCLCSREAPAMSVYCPHCHVDMRMCSACGLLRCDARGCRRVCCLCPQTWDPAARDDLIGGRLDDGQQQRAPPTDALRGRLKTCACKRGACSRTARADPLVFPFCQDCFADEEGEIVTCYCSCRPCVEAKQRLYDDPPEEDDGQSDRSTPYSPTSDRFIEASPEKRPCEPMSQTGASGGTDREAGDQPPAGTSQLTMSAEEQLRLMRPWVPTPAGLRMRLRMLVRKEHRAVGSREEERVRADRLASSRQVSRDGQPTASAAEIGEPPCLGNEGEEVHGGEKSDAEDTDDKRATIEEGRDDDDDEGATGEAALLDVVETRENIHGIPNNNKPAGSCGEAMGTAGAREIQIGHEPAEHRALAERPRELGEQRVSGSQGAASHMEVASETSDSGDDEELDGSTLWLSEREMSELENLIEMAEGELAEAVTKANPPDPPRRSQRVRKQRGCEDPPDREVSVEQQKRAEPPCQLCHATMIPCADCVFWKCGTSECGWSWCLCERERLQSARAGDRKRERVDVPTSKADEQRPADGGWSGEAVARSSQEPSCECEGAGRGKCLGRRTPGSSRCAGCDFDVRTMSYRCDCLCSACRPGEAGNGQLMATVGRESTVWWMQGSVGRNPPPDAGARLAFWEPLPKTPAAGPEAVAGEQTWQSASGGTNKGCKRLPAADRTITTRVIEMLAKDDSELAIRAESSATRELCEGLFDTSTAQPDSTNEAQASAWKYWAEWCEKECTPPWRSVATWTEVEKQREAVLAAGFLRFCHEKQSRRPRNGRPAALVSSAVKALCHIRKLHAEKGYPIVSSKLVAAQAKRLNKEYLEKHGYEHLIPKRKEPFTRELIVNILLSAPDGMALGGTQKLCWASRFGRSLMGMITTLAQTGLRKGEVTVKKRQPECPTNCMSRAAVAWLLRGTMYDSQRAPRELLESPSVGDFVVLTPCPSKSDQLGIVWGGTPIWLPFQREEPLCAFAALARIELEDACWKERVTALFTDDDGQPLVAGRMNKILQHLLLREMPKATTKLYSWHSARIYLATVLKESGASEEEVQALCRWQTPASVKIYARMSNNHYAHLLGRAMKARVSTARAQALSRAMPFLHLPPPKLSEEDQKSSEQKEAEHMEAELEAAGEQPMQARAKPSKEGRAPGPSRAKQPTSGQGRKRTPPMTKKPRQKSKKREAGVEKRSRGPPTGRDADWVSRYGEVIYYPSDIEEHQGFYDRQKKRKPPRERQSA